MKTAAVFSVMLAVAAAQGFDFPPAVETTCAATLCLTGTTCIHEIVDGVRQARCVVTPSPSPPVKPGLCPSPDSFRGQAGICASNCKQDRDCKDNDKCCQNPCGSLTCQSPQGPPPPSCRTMKCDVGETCIMEQLMCIRSPCPRLPVCVKVKEGQCPSPKPAPFDQCRASSCDRDSDCKGSDKCCRNGCGVFHCERPQGLVPPGPTCANVRCGFGQVCEMQEVECVRSPCPPQPVCVDPPPSCDTTVCKKGQMCEMRKVQCFRAPCLPQPVCVDIPTCDTMKCGPGEKCVMTDIRCVRAPCPSPLPQCVPLPDKPGTCPSLRFGLFQSRFCHHQCRSDSECPRQLKCCKTFCGARCVAPEPPCPLKCPPDHTCEMQFTCDKTGCNRRPVCVPVKRCPFFPAVFNCPLRQDTCSDKVPNDCPPGLLCCSTGCGRKCVRPM